MKNNIPIDAFKALYRSRRRKGMYYWWKKGYRWFWSSLGNCGQEDMEDEAINAAKRWIRERKQ